VSERKTFKFKFTSHCKERSLYSKGATKQSPDFKEIASAKNASQ